MPQRRGRTTNVVTALLDVHPLDVVAERCADGWRPDTTWPAFYLAAHVMDCICLKEDEETVPTWGDDVPTPIYIPAEAPELHAAVLVTGGLAARAEWSVVDDDTLLDLAAARWLAPDAEVHLAFRALWAVARSRAGTSNAGARRGGELHRCGHRRRN